jgi:tetratricopeptide (TPR) repeat protein
MKKIIYSILVVTFAGILAIANTGCSARAKVIYHSHRAEKFFAAGQLDKAEIEYINVLRSDDENAAAIGRLGEIYFEEGRFQRAAPFLSRGIQLATNNFDLHLQLGLIYLAIGKTKEARDEANFILGKNPQNDEAPLLLAQASASPQEIAAARQRLQKISQNGDRASLETALGALALRGRDFKTAAADLQRAQKLDPKFAATFTILGTLHRAQNDLKQAGADFKTAAELSPPRSPEKLEFAQFEIQTGNLQAAKIFLDEMTRANSDYLPAWVALAQIALAETNFDGCAANLNTALAREPDGYDALLLSGQLDMARGETGKATDELEHMARLYPQSPRVYYQLARAYLAGNEVEKSIGALQRAVNLDANFDGAILLLADLEIKNGDANSAVALLKPLIRREPELLQASLELADVERAQGNLDGALEIYRQLEKSSPQNLEIPLLAGSTFVQQKNYNAAREEFSRALKLSPDSFQALEQLADLDLTENQSADAAQLVEKAAGKNPRQANLRVLQAKIFLAQDKTNSAETALSTAIKLQPESQPAYLLLAQLYFDTKQNQKALATLDAAIGKNPQDAAAFMLVGMIQADGKNFQAAAGAYEKILAINPKFAPALNNLAWLYSEQLGQIEKGFELAQRARQLFPNDPSTADTLGWILFQKGQFPDAANLLAESARKLPDEQEVQFHLGMTRYMMGDEKSARVAFENALQTKADFSGRDECAECLAILKINPQTANEPERAVLEKRISESPDDLIALGRLAAVFQRDGNPDKAIETDESILKINPQNLGALTNLTRMYSATNPQRALELAKSAYQLSPNDPNVADALGQLARQNGNYKLAFGVLQQASQNQQNNPKILFDFANAAYSVGKVPDAKTAMQNALQAGLTAPQAGEAKNFLDLTAFAANPAQSVAAQTRAQKILESNSNDVPALMVLAIADEQKKIFSVAENIYEKILNHFPDFAPAQKNLAMLYAADGSHLDRAYALATEARESFPNDPELTKTLGVIVFRKADYSRAVTLLKTVRDEADADAELFYYLGISEFHLKNFAESKTSLQRALALNLSTPQAADAREVLAKLKSN